MANISRTVSLKDGTELFISKACLDDAAPLIEYLNLVGGETDHLTFGQNEFHLSIKEEEACISSCLNDNQDLMLVGKTDNKIVSQLYLERFRSSRLNHIGEIGISVKKKYWGKSIAKHMILSAILWSKENQITKLQLHVRTDNINALKLYTNFGFNIEGTIKRAVKIKEAYYDNHLLSLLL